MALNVNRRIELYNILPEGVITTRKWLMDNNFTNHAIDNLVKSSQLESISKGIYVRNKNKITWQSIVFSLQSMLKIDLVVGGLTALEMQGLSHYLSFSENKTVHLYGNDALPKWVMELEGNVKFIKHTTKGFFESNENEKQKDQFTIEREWDNEGRKLIVATPERAYLEVLLQVPTKTTFEHADQLIQGLTTLSPRSLQKLLEQCQNIKAKRLFLWFADRQNYGWLNKLDRDKITLGSGNRVIAKGGKLDNKYKITVPEWL
jgi:hypothetical protein